MQHRLPGFASPKDSCWFVANDCKHSLRRVRHLTEFDEPRPALLDRSVAVIEKQRSGEKPLALENSRQVIEMTAVNHGKCQSEKRVDRSSQPAP